MRGSRPVRPRRFRTGTGNAVHCPGLRRTTAATMAKRAGEAPIIVIKRVRKVAGGHHGGAWKVAYAEFVTAMMAFFLLLWLPTATTGEQKKENRRANGLTPVTNAQHVVRHHPEKKKK